MLTKETITQLQAVLGVENLAELIASEKEETIEIPKLYTEEDKNKFGNNRFDEGKKAFGQIWTKDMRAKFPEVAYDGKTPETFVEKLIEHKISQLDKDPDKKTAELKATNEELKTKLREALDSVDSVKSEYESELFGIKMDQTVASYIPNGTVIPREQVLVLFNSMYEKGTDDDGNVYFKKGGEILKNDVGDYLPAEEIVKTFVEENKYLPKGGMGGGDEGGGDSKTYKSLSAFMDAMEAKGINPMSPEAQEILKKSKEAEDFDNA